MKITKTGTGTATHERAIRDSNGSGLLAIQLGITGTATAKVNGRVSEDAPWVEIRAASASGWLETTARVPYLQLEVTSGSGTATLYVADE